MSDDNDTELTDERLLHEYRRRSASTDRVGTAQWLAANGGALQAARARCAVREAADTVATLGPHEAELERLRTTNPYAARAYLLTHRHQLTTERKARGA